MLTPARPPVGSHAPMAAGPTPEGLLAEQVVPTLDFDAVIDEAQPDTFRGAQQTVVPELFGVHLLARGE